MPGRKTVFIVIGCFILFILGLFLFTQGKSLPLSESKTEDGLSSLGGEVVNEPKKEFGSGPDELVANDSVDKKTSAKENDTRRDSMTDFDKTKSYTALIRTSAGDITIELNAKATPITVKNFVTLAEKKFYDNVIFHRVIKDFMIQGGDPTGTGTGGPGYQFADEPFTGEYTRGTVAMANSGPNTNGSQFFIMHADTPLPKLYVIFGKVTSGIETVDKIATAPTGPGDRPVDPVKMLSVEITVK